MSRFFLGGLYRLYDCAAGFCAAVFRDTPPPNDLNELQINGYRRCSRVGLCTVLIPSGNQSNLSIGLGPAEATEHL